MIEGVAMDRKVQRVTDLLEKCVAYMIYGKRETKFPFVHRNLPAATLRKLSGLTG